MKKEEVINKSNSILKKKYYKKSKSLLEAIKGGEGSGNFDHAGRPGEVGGSSSSGSGTTSGGNSSGGDSGGVTVYHGTVSSFENKIKEEGIQLSKASKVSKSGHVYITSDIESAKYWAEDKAGMLGLDASSTSLVVFEIRIPADVVLSRDVQSHGKNDYQYKGNIPPEWIVGSQIVDFYSAKLSNKKLVPVLFSNGKMYL